VTSEETRTDLGLERLEQIVHFTEAVQSADRIGLAEGPKLGELGIDCAEPISEGRVRHVVVAQLSDTTFDGSSDANT